VVIHYILYSFIKIDIICIIINYIIHTDGLDVHGLKCGGRFSPRVSYDVENEWTHDIRYIYVYTFKVTRTSLAHNLFTSPPTTPKVIFFYTQSIVFLHSKFIYFSICNLKSIKTSYSIKYVQSS